MIDSVAANGPELTWGGGATQKRKSKLNHEGHDPDREFTAEALRAQRYRVLDQKKYSDLCELGVSAVN